MYPKEHTISGTTESTSVACYLDLPFTRDENSNITTNFMTNVMRLVFTCELPFMSSNIPSAPVYGVYASQLLNLFAIPIVVQIIETFDHVTGPS